MSKIFYVGEQKYDIPEELTEQFLAKEPDAVQGLNYIVGDKTFNNIPPLLEEQFIKQNPNAVLQGEPLEKKSIKSNINYEDEQLNSLNQQMLSNMNSNVQFEVQEPEPESPLTPKKQEENTPNYFERLVYLPLARRYAGGGFKKTAGSYLQAMGATSPREEKEVFSSRAGYGYTEKAVTSEEAIQRTKESPIFQKGIELYQSGLRDAANRPDLQPSENYMDYEWTDPRKVASVVGEAVPSLLEVIIPATVATIATKNPTVGVAVASATAFGIETGGMMETAIEAGLEPSDAANVAITVGTINGLISALPAYTLLSRMGIGRKATNEILVNEIIKRGLYKNIGKGALQQGLTEMTEEVLQEGVNIIAETGELGIKLTDKEIKDRFIAAGIGAITLGSVTGAAGGGVQYGKTKTANQETIDLDTGKSQVTEEKPVDPVKTTETVEKPKTEPVEAPSEDVTPVEPTPVSPEITPETEPKIIEQDYDTRVNTPLTETETVEVYTGDIVNAKGETLKWAKPEVKTVNDLQKMAKKLQKYIDERQYSENDQVIDNVYEAERAIEGISTALEQRGLNIDDNFNIIDLQPKVKTEVTPEVLVEAEPTVEEPYAYPRDYDTGTIIGSLEGRTFKTESGRSIEIVRETNETVDYKYVDDAVGKITKVKKGMIGDKLLFRTKRQSIQNKGGVVQWLDSEQVIPTKPVEAPTKSGIQTLSTDWVMKNVNRQVEEIPKPTTEEPNKGAAWRQFTKEIEKEGIKEPIEIVKTDKGWFLSDGLHRLLSANEIGIKDLKVNVVTSKKKITETEAIQEVVDLMQQVDPEVKYETQLDELRTLQDNIDDPKSPETPENAYAQLQAAGEEFVGLEPSDVNIAGENYREVRDGTLVDVVKLHKGANIGTVIEERAETWYKQQEELNPDFDKLITEERKKYYEQTKEIDDTLQSNSEWFSDRAKDNAFGGKPKGKVGAALTRLLKKFKEYADALRKSANRFAKFVEEGKVSKELKSFLDRSVTESLRTPEQIHAELMADVDGRPSPTKITYSLKQTKEIILPSKVKNQGVTFITGDPVNINLKGEYEDFGIRYPRTYKGWALDNPANVTKLLNDTEKGYNVVAITSLVDVKGSMIKNKAYLNAIYRDLENKVGKRKAKSLLNKHQDILKAAKEGKVNAVEVAKETAVPDFSQIARKVVAVATIKDFRTGDSRNRKHPEYKIEVNFDKYIELPQPLDLDTFVKALPKESTRAKMPFYAAKQYWLTVLNQESPQVKMLSDFAQTGDASIFNVEPKSYQFASPQIKEIGLDEAVKNIKSKETTQYHRSIAEVEVELGIKSMTTVAVGEWNTGAEATVMTTITEEVAYDKREYLAAIKGLLGKQEEVLDFEIDPEGSDNLYKINLDVNLKNLPELVKILSEEGIYHKTLPVKGDKVDLVVVDEGGNLVNSVNQITRIYNAKTKLQKGRKTDIGFARNRAKADARYIEIIRKYEGDTGRYSKVLRDRLPVHRPRFNRSVLPKKTRPTYELKKITPDERKLREEKKRKLAELMDEGVEAVKEQIPEFIKNRRKELSLKSFETNAFLNEIKQITTLEQRELIPFLLEGSTSIPKKLNRPDLEKLMQDKKLIQNIQPVVESFRQRYKELWKRISEGNQELSNKEIKDYVTHIWDVPSNKKSDVVQWFTTHNKFTEKRYIETLMEGIEDYDLKPKYTDINDIFNIYSSIANNSLANKQFVADLKKLNVGGKPMITTAQHAPDGWSEIHHSAMKNPFTKAYYKVHPDIVAPIKVVLGNRIELEGAAGKIQSAYEVLNGVVKQAQLSISLFHHLALSETAMPISSYRDVPKMLGVVLKTPWQGFIKMESDVWKKQDLAKDFISHLGQLGVSADIPVQQISESLKSIEVKFKGTPIVGKAAKLATGFYDKWNFALWDYLHDHFKLYAYESLVSRYKGNDIDTYKYEIAQLVNDTFGGQNWDVLMVNPQTVQMMTWFLLSPDWTVSTMRQALAPTGLGSATKTKEGKKIRAKAGKRFWLKAMLYYGAGINLLNILNRRGDMEEYPEYYPDKEDWGFWDYTMFGNTIGSQTRLFMGRYEDGSERYIRWGKQFREFPELLYDDTGFNFPQSAIKKLGGKAAPLPQLGSQIFTGKTLSGFDNYDLKDKKGVEFVYGLTKTIMKTPLPFATQSMLNKTKEWNLSDIAVPSSRGMTARKAGDLMEIALGKNDLEMMRQIIIGCSRSGINGLDIQINTMNRIKNNYRAEETRLLKEYDDLMKKAKDPNTSPSMKKHLMDKANNKKVNASKAKNPQILYRQGIIKLYEEKRKFPEVFGEVTEADKKLIKSL